MVLPFGAVLRENTACGSDVRYLQGCRKELAWFCKDTSVSELSSIEAYDLMQECVPTLVHLELVEGFAFSTSS